VGDARVTARDRDFSELIEDRRRRGMDQRAEDRDREHGTIALGNPPQNRHFGFVEFGERDFVEPLDFVGIGDGRLPGRRPNDDGGHPEARARREIIQLSQHIRWREAEPDLFVGFTQRRFDDRLVAVEAATGECELAGVVSQMRTSAGDQETSLIRLIRGDYDGDGGRTEFGIRLNLAFETR